MSDRQYLRKTYRDESRIKKISLFLIKTGLFLVLMAVSLGLGVFVYFAKDLPRPEVFAERQLILPTEIYDRTGEVLLRTIYGEEKREIIAIENVPNHFIEAILASEDANFYKHHGIDFRAIVRAIMVDLKMKKPAQGASTISQQLIRSTFLTIEKTPKRKISEIILTLEMERRHSKEQILEWYLNQVPFGPNIYGAGTVSMAYFDKPIEEITLAESAILASLIRAPSSLSPYGPNREKLFQVQKHILDRMEIVGFISAEQANKAKEEEVEFIKPASNFNIAPHFILYVENYLKQEYKEAYLKTHGFKVYTTIDIEIQEKAQELVKQGVEKNKIYNAHNASLVAIDPKNGEILAMVGSKDYFSESFPEDCVPGKNCLFEPGVNIATYGQGQQPGSAFKPFVYATAFEKGYTPDSIVIDERTNFGKWGDKDYIPQNYDGRHRGAVTLRQALAQSLNIPAVKMILAAGIANSINTARDMGITTLNQKPSFYGPALVLGAGEVKLMELVSAYGVFSANGLRVPPTPILKIEDQTGNIIKENKKTPRRVISEETAEKINDIISDNNARAPMFGSNSQLYFPGYWVAAKTGTTDGFRDSWAIGYSRAIAVGVWAGNNDKTPMARKPAITIAGPMWHEFMAYVLSRGYQ
jgi:penicillin-binding protein 1C